MELDFVGEFGGGAKKLQSGGGQVNLEKIIEWAAIILVVILGARWLAGLFGTGDPVTGPGPQLYAPGGYAGYRTGVVFGQPLGVPQYSYLIGVHGGRRRGR